MTRHFRVHTLTTMAWIWESSAVSTHPHTSSPSLIPPPPPQLKTAGGGNTSPHPQPGAGRPGHPAEARDALDGGYLQGPAAVPQDQRPEGGRGPKGGAEHSHTQIVACSTRPTPRCWPERLLPLRGAGQDAAPTRGEVIKRGEGGEGVVAPGEVGKGFLERVQGVREHGREVPMVCL